MSVARGDRGGERDRGIYMERDRGSGVGILDLIKGAVFLQLDLILFYL